MSAAGIGPLVRALYLLQVEVAFLRSRAGFEKWIPGDDVDYDIASWAFRSGFSACCAAPFKRKDGHGTEEFCSACDAHLGHRHQGGG